jgi:hypothetical protein
VNAAILGALVFFVAFAVDLAPVLFRHTRDTRT